MGANAKYLVTSGAPVGDKNPLPVKQCNLNGADYYADTAAHAGSWHAITAVEAAVAALVAADWGGGALTAVPIPAGTTLHGKFTSIVLASGKVVAYRA